MSTRNIQDGKANSQGHKEEQNVSAFPITMNGAFFSPLTIHFARSCGHHPESCSTETVFHVNGAVIV